MNTSREDANRRAKDTLLFCFGSSKPPLAYLPHCVVPQDEATLATILNRLRVEGAIFGASPQWGPDERPFLGSNEEGFGLWKLSRNQEYFRRHGAHARLDQFTAVIDSRTPRELISQMYATAQDPQIGLAYDWWIENIARWIPQLRWAYIPMTEDTRFAIFVMRTGDEKLVQDVRYDLVGRHIRAFSLKVRGDAIHWPSEITIL